VNFEFVDYYPVKNQGKNCTLGTCHVYWIDQQMDIRGIKVRKEGHVIRYYLPQLIGYDDDGNPVRYPVISFTDPTKLRTLYRFCQEHVTPLIFPSKEAV
jgi:hypothetical protein